MRIPDSKSFESLCNVITNREFDGLTFLLGNPKRQKIE